MYTDSLRSASQSVYVTYDCISEIYIYIYIYLTYTDSLRSASQSVYIVTNDCISEIYIYILYVYRLVALRESVCIRHL